MGTDISDQFILATLFVLSAVSAVLSGAIAGRRGYSALMYAGAGLFLGLGAVPMTYFATAHANRRLTDEEGTGFIPVQTCPEVEGVSGDRVEATADLDSWGNLCSGVQQGLILSVILLGCGLMVVTSYTVATILPTFVTLFEGMSLKLPFPTQILITVTKLFRQPSVAFCCWLGSLIYPGGAYYLLLTAGYRLPVLGRIWKKTDRLWQLYAVKAFGERWSSHIPAVVRARLERFSSAPVPVQEGSLESAIRRQRDDLSAVLWASVPILLILFATVASLYILVSWAMFAPLHGCVGNLD